MQYKQKNNIIISLGCNCFPRIFATLTGLKPRKAQGELSMPFDLSFSTIDALVHFLKTDFEDFFDDVSYDDKRNYYMNHKHYMGFNHDIDCENTEEGYEKLKIRYKNRIQNFRDCLKSNEHLFFIYNTQIKQEQEINDIFNIINSRRLNKNFTLIVLDMNVTINKALLNEKIELCAIKHPFNEWNDWHLKENKEKCMDLYWKFEKVVKKIIEEKLFLNSET